MSAHYDIVIIGSGAGGGTIARALASTGRSILVIERGGTFERDAGNWDPAVVWIEQRYRATERWLTPEGDFQPNTHYGVGGNTKFWGTVLYRLRAEDFEATEQADGESPAWPIRHEDLAPYYDRAEQMYHVHGEAGADPTDPPRRAFPHPPIPHTIGMQRTIEQLRSQGLHPSPLPLGLIRPGEEGGCRLCDTCNSFPCMIGAKSDSETCGIEPARQMSSNVHLEEHTLATRLVTDPPGTRVVAVDVETRGTPRRISGDLFIVSCGAVNSAALLLRSGNGSRGLANSSGLVGRNYMAHVTTMYSAYGWRDVKAGPHDFQKTVAINDYYRPGAGRYALGHIQSQGTIQPELIFGGAPQKYHRWIRMVHRLRPTAFKEWTDRSMQWLAMTEDLPSPRNCVTLRGDRICLTYQPSNTKTHNELKKRVKTMLRACGLKARFGVSFGLGNTTHQCGTLRFGADAHTSVLDPWCRTHDVENLFVVDASFFPSSAAVNPGLTIIAQALRVADHIRERDLHLEKDR